MIDTARRQLIEIYLAAYNHFDIPAMLAALTDDVRFEHHQGGELSVATNGKADLEKLARVGAQLFAAREQTIVSVEERGSDLVATIDFRGEIAEDIPEGPRAGTIIEMQGTTEFGFANGKINKVIDRA
ncbi:nuclear transport factor 2 family protein [Luteibacter aegosomatissinici]|uniref:nuclear transport factor 2 family protein n=1 Tax=Luteibacter aegosomatissinici TaxID=2911539 RepID=UPI001FF7A155|nr:nuclear transport factor 2 family protein [Luteibacter aegosomatissinici]UPG95209.1 nuclear transport factor 2 family protein [Luteibacter aegosomatissinici]